MRNFYDFKNSFAERKPIKERYSLTLNELKTQDESDESDLTSGLKRYIKDIIDNTTDIDNIDIDDVVDDYELEEHPVDIDPRLNLYVNNVSGEDIIKDDSKKTDSDKKQKTKKFFKKGDIIKCISNDKGKLPEDCHQFLLTYKKFKVIDVNENLNIDIGHRLQENGHPYYFTPDRFELINGTAPLKTVEKKNVRSKK
jgi:hypothetical protein